MLPSTFDADLLNLNFTIRPSEYSISQNIPFIHFESLLSQNYDFSAAIFCYFGEFVLVVIVSVYFCEPSIRLLEPGILKTEVSRAREV
jgi:hypothetical protein